MPECRRSEYRHYIGISEILAYPNEDFPDLVPFFFQTGHANWNHDVCSHTGPLKPRCEAALRAAAITVTACGSSRSAIDRGTLEACRWNLEFKVFLNFYQTRLFIQHRSNSILLLQKLK